MNSINRTLKYVDLYLVCNLDNIIDYKLPTGYKVWEEKESIIGVNDGKNVYKYNYKYCNNKLEIIGEEKYEQENR